MPDISTSMVERRSPKATRLLVIFVIASLVIITAYAREGSRGPVHALRGVVQTVASPFQLVGSQIEKPFAAIDAFFTNASADSATLSELSDENSRLTAQLAQMNEYANENARLASLVGLTDAYDLSGVAARVVATSSDDWSDTITIDKGSSSGIKVDLPVVTGGGVVGQVVSVSATTSVVRLVTDPEMGISAMLQNSRAVGVLTGSVDGSLSLTYVSSDTDVLVGEIVVTSGLGGVYPKGLPIGVVTTTTPSSSGQYREITVRPIWPSQHYEEVYVVTSYDDGLDGTELATSFVRDAGFDAASAATATSATADAQPAQDASGQASAALASGTGAGAGAVEADTQATTDEQADGQTDGQTEGGA